LAIEIKRSIRALSVLLFSLFVFTSFCHAFSLQTGYYVGTGQEKSITGAGFRPDLVIIKSDASSGRAVWKSSAMAGDSTAYFENAAVNFSGAISSLDNDGFSIGTNSLVNTANVRYTWVAFSGSGGADFKVGSYSGDGNTSREVTDVGFQPDLVFVKADFAARAVWRSSAMPYDVSQHFYTAAQVASRIKGFTSQGFIAGSAAEVNQSGSDYFYVAFKSAAGSMAVGTYSGTGIGHSITGVGFKPDLIFLKQTTSSNPAVLRTDKSYGDESQLFTAAANVTDSISTLESDGFFVGSQSRVNDSSQTYYYAAFTGATAPVLSGNFMMSNGSYFGNGTSKSITGIPFNPSMVLIKADTANYAVFCTSAMPSNSTAYMAAATANLAGAILSIDDNGFSVGSNAVVNTNGVSYRWTAFQTDQSENFAIGAYTGNGQDNRLISALGFQPDLVVIKGTGATSAVLKTSSMAGDTTAFFSAAADVSNRIKSLDSGGFQVGTSSEVNTAATLYYYCAFKNTAGQFKVGSYTGDGTADNTISGIGFRPAAVWVKRPEASNGAVQRNSNIGADNSQYFTNTANASNEITSLNADDFHVGSANGVNALGTTYRYAAWKNTSTALGFAAQPCTTEAGAVITPTVEIQVLDNLGNLDSTDSTTVVTLGIGTNPSGGTLSGTKVKTVSSGIATFDGISLDKSGSGYTLIASATGLTQATSSAFSITASAGSALSFSVQPTSAVAGSAIDPSIKVAVKDAYGNTVVSNEVAEITLSLYSNPGGATMSGTLTKTVSSGEAIFSDISLDKSSAIYSLIASASALATCTSDSFDISPAVAERLTFSTQPSTTETATVIFPYPAVRVKDALGNTVTEDNSTIVVVSLESSASAALSGTLSKTVCSGEAVFSDLSVNWISSGCLLRASAASLLSAASNTFNVTAETSAPVVTSLIPADKATGVSKEAHISVVFSKPMDPSSVQNAFTLKAIKDNEGATIETNVLGTFSWAGQNNVVLIPYSEMADNYTYEVGISKEAKSLTGISFEEPFSGEFSIISNRSNSNVFIGSDGKTKISLPAGALAQDYYIKISIDPRTDPIVVDPAKIEIAGIKVQAESDPFKYPIDSSMREFEIYDRAGSRIISSFSAEAAITIPYSDSNNDGIVDDTNPAMRADSLLIAHLDEVNNIWVLNPESTVNTSLKNVTCNVNHLSTFSLMAMPATTLANIYCFPNPYKPSAGHTTITFSNLPSTCTIKIYTLKGELIKTIEETNGDAQATWDVANEAGENVVSGLYVFLVKTDSDQKSGKLVIIR